jgi:ribA/ribD-fused uncharacterized protein
MTDNTIYISPQRLPTHNPDNSYLSNMYPCTVLVDDFGEMVEFPSSEHYYQFLKHKDVVIHMTNDETYYQIVNTKSEDGIHWLECCTTKGISGYTIKKWARNRPWLRSNWDSIKLMVMERAITYKFDSNPDLLQKLLDTGDRPIVEMVDWNDTFWGIDYYSKVGQNHLGKLLMKYRDSKIIS